MTLLAVWSETIARWSTHLEKCAGCAHRVRTGSLTLCAEGEPLAVAVLGLSAPAAKRVAGLEARAVESRPPAACVCYHTCAEDPETACSLSGGFHVHAGEPCSVHPDAPGDA